MNRKPRREIMRQMQSEDLNLEVVHPHAAGIDIGNAAHYVAVPPSRDPQPVRCFGCTTAELKTMAEWLKQCGIRTGASLPDPMDYPIHRIRGEAALFAAKTDRKDLPDPMDARRNHNSQKR